MLYGHFGSYLGLSSREIYAEKESSEEWEYLTQMK